MTIKQELKAVLSGQDFTGDNYRVRDGKLYKFSVSGNVWRLIAERQGRVTFLGDNMFFSEMDTIFIKAYERQANNRGERQANDEQWVTQMMKGVSHE